MDPTLVAIGALVLGAVVGFAYQNFVRAKLPQKTSEKTKPAETSQAKELIIEAKDEAYRIKREAEEDMIKNPA